MYNILNNIIIVLLLKFFTGTMATCYVAYARFYFNHSNKLVFGFSDMTLFYYFVKF